MFSFPPYLLPAPSAIIESMDTNAAVLLKQSVGTTVEILLGFALSVVVGVPLALAIFLWKPFARMVYPLLISSQAVPKVAIAPLFLVWFGFGLMPKVLIAFLIAFFPVVINTAMGLGIAGAREDLPCAIHGAWAPWRPSSRSNCPTRCRRSSPD